MNYFKSIVVALALVTFIHVEAMEFQSVDGYKSDLRALHKNNMWTLVMIWSLDCVACEKQKPMIERFHKEHHLANAHVVGVVSDGNEHISAITQRINENQYSFESYIPNTSNFDSEYLDLTHKPFRGTPTYLIFEPGGKIAGVHEGVLQRAQLEKIVGPATKLLSPSIDLIR